MSKIWYVFLMVISLLMMRCQLGSVKTKAPLDVKDKLKEPQGFIADEETARKVAETIWLSIYGNVVLEEKPYTTRLMGDSVWIVEGSLKSQVGGTAYIELRKADGTVLKVTHGK